MLFNTLAYAKFFGIVFVVSWLLVSRRSAVLLPWFALAGYALLGPFSLPSAAVTAAALGLTLWLRRQCAEGEPPPVRITLASLSVNFVAMAFLTVRVTGRDPLSLGLSALGVPVGRSLPWLAGGALLGCLLAYWLMRAKKVRLLFILLASYVFYAHWDWRFLPLIWGSSTIDWLLGHAIARAGTARQRKLWLAGTVVVNLGVLAVFKYFNFGVETATRVLSDWGYHPPQIVLKIALPVGISFFTFESMSYVIDVYRRQIEPHKSYLEYLSFVAFFPHLVAGPIVRPRDLLPQLAGPARWNSREGSEALFLIAFGLIKKVAIGDYLALNLVDRVFDAPLSYSALETYSAVLGYAVQIYCDFSGYTDIAIGSALLLGVRFPKNFNAPYKAHNLSDFWRRWHISLSTWLRDYLYIPLGGNRGSLLQSLFNRIVPAGKLRRLLEEWIGGPFKATDNLMITMLLGGLWHGASWTFVVWGGLHGLALVATHSYQRYRAKLGFKEWRSRWVHVGCVLMTFHFVCACWIYFRAPTFPQARLIISRLTTLTTYHPNLPWKVLAVLAVGLLSHWMPEAWYRRLRQSFVHMPAFAQAIVLFLAFWTLKEMASSVAVPFVYFQF